VRAIRNNGFITALLTVAIAGAAAAAIPAAAATAARTAGAAPAAGGSERNVCPAPRPGWASCQAVYQLAGGSAGNAPAFVSAASPVGGYGPTSLRQAYNLTRDSLARGRHETVAIVDAYRDPYAASDLASYRSFFHLGQCTTASGCLRIVNQNGRSKSLPKAHSDWAVEQSLDLDMVSAICPHCHILLVEARSSANTNLGKAEDTAVRLGARFVSNSWSSTEEKGQSADNHYFNHPGVAIVVASGDSGYGTSYPGDLQYVTSVGGTELTHHKSGTRGWTETVWGSASKDAEGTGSGCSTLTAKPSWQRAAIDIGASGCLDRTQNDVSAVADPATGVAVYDTYKTRGTWALVGGTSAATPIIAATYALAGDPAPRSYPASYVYQHPGHFHDVTSGADGVCPAARVYLCQARKGYDGPTGMGTPLGVTGFSASGTDPVTLVDPGSQREAAGAIQVKITGLDTRAGARSLAWTATGLPAGVAVQAVSGLTDATLTGKVAASVAAGTVYHVVVTATDRKTKASGVTRFTITVT
jgi:Subtilase family